MEEKDELNFVSKWILGIIAKIAKRSIRKNIGVDTDIKFKELNAYTFNGKVHIHVNTDIVLDQKDLSKLLKLEEP